jgi:O-antigen biosynthesis protein WbqV
MGDPIRIQDLAENLIILSGMTPGKDIAIAYTGVRDGEKLSEDLFYREADRSPTSCTNIVREHVEAPPSLDDSLDAILKDLDGMTGEDVRRAVENLLETPRICPLP